MKNLAPISISTYIRIDHLKQTVKALAENRLASQSDLYVFSDGPRPGDEEKVQAVRNFLDTVTGFKSINVFKRTGNGRVLNNRGGMAEVLEKFGKIIFLEEDVITAPEFLSFINAGLDLTEDRKDITAVCGYTPPIRIPTSYGAEAFLSPRFSAWGFGMWKHTYDNIIFDKSQYQALLADPVRLKEFRQGGEDLPSLLRREANDEIDAMDVKIFFTQFVNQQFVLCPTSSLTRNIGFDGTGLHCGTTDRFDTELKLASRSDFSQMEIPLPNAEICHLLYLFRSQLPESYLLRMLTQHLIRPTRHRIGRVLKMFRGKRSTNSDTNRRTTK